MSLLALARKQIFGPKHKGHGKTIFGLTPSVTEIISTVTCSRWRLHVADSNTGSLRLVLRWTGRSCQSPAMRRQRRPSALPRTPSWCRSSGGPLVAALTARLRRSTWWTCAPRLTSPLNTSWRWQSCGPPPLRCQTSVPSCFPTGQ